MKKVLKWSSVILAAGVSLLLLIYALRGPLVSPHLARFIIGTAGSELGLQLEIGAISGSYLGSLELSDVRTVEPNPAGPLVSVDADTLQARYSLFSLRSGLSGFLSTLAIRIDGANVDISVPQDSPPPDNENPRAFAGFPTGLPSVRIENSAVTIESGNLENRFEGISLTAATDRRTAETRLQLSVADWRWNHPSMHERSTSLSAAATVTEAAVSVDRLELGGGTVVATGRADLRDAPAEVPFRAEARISGAAVELDGTWTEPALTLETRARQLDLGGLADVFKLPFDRLAGKVDWRADMRIPAGSPAPTEAGLELAVSGGRIHETAVDRVELKAELKEGLLVIERLAARGEDSVLSIEPLSAPAPLLFAGQWDRLVDRISGGFSLQVRNLPAFLGNLGVHLQAPAHPPDHSLNLRGEVRQGTVSVAEGRLATAGASITLDPLEVRIPTTGRPWKTASIRGGGTLEISTLQPVDALLGLPGDVDGALKSRLTVGGTLGEPTGRATVDGRNISWGGLEADRVAIDVSADARRISLHEFEIGRGVDRIAGEGAYDLSSGNLEGVRVELNIAEIHPYLAALASAGEWLEPAGAHLKGRAGGRVTLSGPLRRPDGAAELSLSGLSFEDRPFGDASLQVRKRGDLVSIGQARLENGGDLISLRGQVNLAERSAPELTLTARVDDIGRYTRGLAPPEWRASGGVRIDATGSGTPAEPAARVQAELKEFSVGKFAAADAELQARADGRLFYVDRLRVERPDLRLAVSGMIRNHDAQGRLAFSLDTCEVRYHDLNLSLTRPAELDYFLNGAVTVERAEFEGPSGRLSAAGTVSRAGNSDFRAEIADLSGGDWFGTLSGGRIRFEELDADLRLTGDMRSPVIQAAGNAAGIDIEGYPDLLSGSFEVNVNPQAVYVDRVSLRGPSGLDLFLKGDFPVRIGPGLDLLPGTVSAQGKLKIPDLRLLNAFVRPAIVAGGELETRFEIGGSWRRPVGSLLLRARSVDIDTHRRPQPPGPFDVDAELGIEGPKLEIQTLRLTGEVLNATAQGVWTGLPPPADWLGGPEFKPQGELALEGKLTVPDIGWVARELDSLRRTGGRLEADLRLEGPVAKPGVLASVRISEGRLQADSGVPPVSDISLNALLDTEKLRLDRLEARVGGAPVRASGSLLWDGSDPDALSLSLEGTNLLVYRDENALIRADADLELSGPLDSASLTGVLSVTKGLVKKNLNIFGALRSPAGPRAGTGLQLFSLTGQPFRDWRFDVELTSESPVEISGNIVQGAVRPRLHLGGSGLLPVLTGNVYVDGTRVNLPSGKLAFDSGVVRFLETDPEVPVLELNGDSRMLGYDISVLVEGPYNEPEITLSSTPPLPSDELMMMLLTGRPPEGTLGKSAKQRQSIQVAVYVARDLLDTFFSGDASEDPSELDEILDRFDFQVGRDVTRSGDETIEARFRLAEGLLLDRDRLYITGEKDTYDYINTGIKLVFRFK